MIKQEFNASQIPKAIRPFIAIGDETAKAVNELYIGDQQNLFGPETIPELDELAIALGKDWSDAQSARLIKSIDLERRKGKKIEVKALSRWSLAHTNDSDAVFDCMMANPPQEIEIIRLLSRSGSQKLVFLATWKLTQQEVVLKKLVASGDDAERILRRELQPHPLNMTHPNIIETHFLRNNDGETFLVEQRLPVLLDDTWRSHGIHEASNLLYDIGQAIKFLHENGLVHGDVKPDNIGKRGDHYILLDFGICRPIGQFTKETTPTGSLRTRAPEFIEEGNQQNPEKADVWALGATIFNVITGRFPLINSNEKIPRISDPKERTEFEIMLANRIKNEWDRWTDLTSIPEPLKYVLTAALLRDPIQRISSVEMISKIEHDLPAFLRSSTTGHGKFSAVEEITQIKKYLVISGALNIMPRARKYSLLARMKQIQSTQGFPIDQKDEVQNIIDILSNGNN